jgi:hypothetical protein
VGVSGARAAAVPVGFDVSYPQCGQTLPAGGGVAIVGVNGGLPFSGNPCVGSELVWAGTSAELYANTADPGPLLSSHWPNGQTVPQQCNTPDAPGEDTTSCAYDYGWNAAKDSYADAVAGYVAAGLAPAGATATPQPNAWWLDVELENSWEATVANNLSELQGEVDYLRSVGVSTIGFYASTAAWATITGNSTQFSPDPFWLPGAGSLADAQGRCAATAPNGGQTTLVQFPQGSVNADLICASVLMLTGVPSQIAAGKPSPPLTVKVPAAPAATLTVALTASSTTGRYSLTANGPWTRTLVVPLQAGETMSAPFYYRDSSPHAAQLTAAAGYASTVATLTVTAPACTLPTPTDHGPEIAVAQVKTKSAAIRDKQTLDEHLKSNGLHATARVEQDACTTYELAVDSPHLRAQPALLHALRAVYQHATIETR